MVQNLGSVSQATQLSKSTASNPGGTSLVKHWNENFLVERLNCKVKQILKYADELSKIDPSTEKVVKSLAEYSNGVDFRAVGCASLQVNDATRTLSLSVETVNLLCQRIPKEWLHVGLAVFLCHEASHIADRLKKHEDVQRMKGVGLERARERMGEIDLRSDFLSVQTLSITLAFKQYGKYCRREHIHWFYEIWRNVCGAMLGVFPTSNRRDKQQRTFGYLLMANLIRDTHIGNYPLEFNAELWPVWNEALDYISIYSSGDPLIPGSSVDPRLMGQILNDISDGNYNIAASNIGKLWSQLPRR